VTTPYGETSYEEEVNDKRNASVVENED